MSGLPIRLALGPYDRTRALIDGSVRAEGVDLELVVMDDAFARHEQMLTQAAFDVCELSLSSYLMARQRGQASRLAAGCLPASTSARARRRSWSG